jgi:hypothetical protein
MAALKTPANSPVQYRVTDAHGKSVDLKAGSPAVSGQPATIKINSAGAEHVLTQQNIVDLLPALTGFANTGILS